MSQTASSIRQQKNDASVARVDMKLEVQLLPVTDVDRAKEFYTKLGWQLDADIVVGNLGHFDTAALRLEDVPEFQTSTLNEIKARQRTPRTDSMSYFASSFPLRKPGTTPFSLRSCAKALAALLLDFALRRCGRIKWTILSSRVPQWGFPGFPSLRFGLPVKGPLRGVSGRWKTKK